MLGREVPAGEGRGPHWCAELHPQRTREQNKLTPTQAQTVIARRDGDEPAALDGTHGAFARFGGDVTGNKHGLGLPARQPSPHRKLPWARRREARGIQMKITGKAALTVHPADGKRRQVLPSRPQLARRRDLLLEQACGHERPVVDLPNDLLLAGVVLHNVLSACVCLGRGLALRRGVTVALVRVAP